MSGLHKRSQLESSRDQDILPKCVIYPLSIDCGEAFNYQIIEGTTLVIYYLAQLWCEIEGSQGTTRSC